LTGPLRDIETFSKAMSEQLVKGGWPILIQFMSMVIEILKKSRGPKSPLKGK
jgi:hypothetical protein